MGRKYSLFILFKMLDEGRCFLEKRLSRGKSYLKTTIWPIVVVIFISKGLQFLYINFNCDCRYLFLRSKWQIFDKIVELCRVCSRLECPQIILFFKFLHQFAFELS